VCGYWLWHVLRLESLLHDMIEGRMRGKATRGSKRMHLLSDLMKGKYVALKRTAEDRKDWQKLIRAGSHRPASQQITWMYTTATRCSKYKQRRRHVCSPRMTVLWASSLHHTSEREADATWQKTSMQSRHNLAICMQHVYNISSVRTPLQWSTMYCNSLHQILV